ncbi:MULTISPECIES: hypothetical protein [unclassified Bradyrhizobium]|uniref:hypothetical protein n=1 Tax=unclassified Bradyrhizobium TaxID=2631580 RepID=UPI001CD2FD1C|nr:MULTISPECIES: hypothetical protein [unclassified Bradyrhizobium]MCA1386357.1 hypothetical protein [Bradyrhizobium sp. BRP05]MCA1394460.1 hypothetical protein [Bradyrhizobium sp. IC3123]MCA1423953.1 hypothetical protein [Bradyrhizobium sp. BRP23]MCA1480531.1 hypothetical protein [Bradyrhizobium sp. NBAIM08]MCA1509183.1 hypothetical protein [Bradyrhizobium sp. NBAIM02]
MKAFTKIILFTDKDGRARFREETIDLSEGTSQMQLSARLPCSGYQVRQSPVGFAWSFHCSGSPLWVFILRGQMEITLQDGSSRVFKPGDCFYAADTLPAGATFNEKVHGHSTRQVGSDPLITMFVHD